MTLLLGDCLETMKTLADNSVDAVITDPPYGLAFMGKKWDYDVPSVDVWREVFRVMKPGAHLLSFGGTRTYHRMVVAIEDAGFEIRDQVMWIYGSGFPKSLDVSKAIDKAAGAEREIVGFDPACRLASNTNMNDDGWSKIGTQGANITLPATELAKRWQGFGTALKPANEPIVLARKPLEKGLTVAANVLKWGCGAINVDAGRIGAELIQGGRAGRKDASSFNVSIGEKQPMHQGRWPANVLFDEDAALGLGENARYFYCAKTSKRERNAGLEGMPERESGIKNDSGRGFSESDPYKKIVNKNNHPTVKPIKLMQYLIKLITPPGGAVLDPFMGSGSTGCAALSLGFDFIGCEMSQEYFEIAKKRIEHWSIEEETA